MAIHCEFHLSRASAVYYTGEQVSGHISVTAGKRLLQLEALSISLSCRSSVGWTEAEHSLPQVEHNDSEAVSQPATIQYACNKLHLQQTQQLLQALNLPSGGTQRCNFEFELPHNLPASCRLPLGGTSYMLQVLLQRRGKHDKHFERRLCVRQRIELPDLLPASSSNASLRLCLPRSVFAPGQRVAYQLQLHAAVPAKCHARLYQSITYRADRPAPKTKRVQRLLDESCDWTGVLHLPLTSPIMTQLAGEPIQIDYYVEAASSSSSSSSEPLRLPLRVGTVAPPVDVMVSPTDGPTLGIVNLGLSENEVLLSSLSQLLPQSCSRESHAPAITRRGEQQLKLLRRQKKRSYVLLAWRYLYTNLLAAN